MNTNEKQELTPLPKLLQYYRKKKKYTQSEIADMLHISRSGYANYEEGRCTPSMEQIVKLSKILDYDFLFAFSLEFRTPEPSVSYVNDNVTYLPHNNSHYKMGKFENMFFRLKKEEQNMIINYMESKMEQYYPEHFKEEANE